MHAIYMYIIIITKEMSPEEIQNNKKTSKTRNNNIVCRSNSSDIIYSSMQYPKYSRGRPADFIKLVIPCSVRDVGWLKAPSLQPHAASDQKQV